MKIIKLYALGLLLISSFNVLGATCKISGHILFKEGITSYFISSSVYSYKDNISTCRCKSGYEFSPSIPTGKIVKELEGNAFPDPIPSLEEKTQNLELRCVALKDDTKLSVAEWAIPVSVLSVAAIGAPIGYSVFKFKKGLSGNIFNTDADANTIEMNEDGYLAPANTNPGTIEIDRDGYLSPANTNSGTIETPMDGGYLTSDEMNFGANNYITPVTNTDPQVDLDNVTIDSSSTDSEYFSADDSDPRYIDPIHTENQVESVERTIGDAIEENPYSGNSDRHIYADINEQDMVPDSEVAGGSGDLSSATADARIRNVSPDAEGEYNEIANNVNGTCNIL
ncbi:hypothetical protein BAZOLSSOX_1735 [uncultured Gammaproteobacteria bacterium]|nr:hypothetical protein BAZOLSSOX_1735 [uncultured Gammaproteobacteria bacterium]